MVRSVCDIGGGIKVQDIGLLYSFDVVNREARLFRIQLVLAVRAAHNRDILIDPTLIPDEPRLGLRAGGPLNAFAMYRFVM